MYCRNKFINPKLQIMKANWKTTIGGILAAVGSYLVNSQTGTLNLVGQIAQVIGMFLIGAMAQDAKAAKKED
jgi:mannose/fructose/N-acetylgalactosamine-specific phosphotransferase system component IID